MMCNVPSLMPFSHAKGKELFPESPLYFVLDGTDPRERFFGNYRMQYKSKCMNCLEIIDLSRNMLACDNILMNEHLAGQVLLMVVLLALQVLSVEKGTAYQIMFSLQKESRSGKYAQSCWWTYSKG